MLEGARKPASPMPTPPMYGGRYLSEYSSAALFELIRVFVTADRMLDFAGCDDRNLQLTCEVMGELVKRGERVTG